MIEINQVQEEKAMAGDSVFPNDCMNKSYSVEPFSSKFKQHILKGVFYHTSLERLFIFMTSDHNTGADITGESVQADKNKKEYDCLPLLHVQI